jgi:8-oxo-dGTP pyrophosphatase MutT (NUDIX family)
MPGSALNGSFQQTLILKPNRLSFKVNTALFAERWAIIVIQNRQQRAIAIDDTIIHQIREKLNGNGLSTDWRVPDKHTQKGGSAVLFLLSRHCFDGQRHLEPCLILNKRSQRVLQPGDLCCPGGGVEPLDRLLSRVLRWPFSPLFGWPPWRRWQAKDPQLARGLSLMLGAGLREAWEEMRLNPLRVTFLGPLQVQPLILFNRSIYPLAGWVSSVKGLQPNWEVERLVLIPLRHLLEPHRYGRYRLYYAAQGGERQRQEDFPCFIHQGRQGREVLWGATFRIAIDFLERVYGFQPPHPDTVPVVTGRLDRAYMNGSTMDGSNKPPQESPEDF